MSAPIYIDLHDVCPKVEYDYSPNYPAHEKAVLTPAIRKAGYETDGHWVTGDGDSFGPLTRYTIATKDGKTVRVVYG